MYLRKTKINIKFFVVFFLASVAFFDGSIFGFSLTAHADASTTTGTTIIIPPSDSDNECGITNIGNCFVMGIDLLLYGIFWVVSQPVSIAADILGYVLDPPSMKAIFNQPKIYVVWQMVRDFFNLFFILALLFSAFATIFQIDQYHAKKILPKVVLMALLVNFSYPISRFIIDATNVPMYFFFESTFADKAQSTGKNVVEVAFSASNMRNIILPNVNTETITGGHYELGGLAQQLIIAIIFMFIFGVSLLVLSIFYLIRMIMLLILVIFSPAGFAGLAIPGFQKYAHMWWDKLLQYALFGPAAALMILVAVNVMQAFSVENKLKEFASTTGAASPTFLASMAQAIVPIILIWVAMTVGQTMGIAGSGMVTSKAQNFSRWAGRKGLRYGGYLGAFLGSAIPAGIVAAATKGKVVPLATPMNLKALGYGAQEGWKGFKKSGKIFGKQIGIAKPFTEQAQEERSALAAGYFKGGSKGRENAKEDLARRRTYERAEDLKKNNIGNSQLLEKLAKSNQVTNANGEIEYKDPIEAGAAALLLSERRVAMSADQFSNALIALGKNTKEVSALIASADLSLINGDDYKKILDSKAFGDANTRDAMITTLNQKLKKDGQLKAIVDYEAKHNRKEGESEEAAYDRAYQVHFDISATDIANQSGIFEDPHFRRYATRMAAQSPKSAQKLLDKLAESKNRQYESVMEDIIVSAKSSKPIATDTNIAAAKRDAASQNKPA